MTTSPGLRCPNGLGWEETVGSGTWRGRAQTAFSGRQALLMIAAPFVAFFVFGAVALTSGSIVAGLAVGLVAGSASLVGALRRRSPIVLLLDSFGVAREGSKPIGPLAEIERFEMVYRPGVVGAPANQIYVHLRGRQPFALELEENDPLYLRFMAQQLERALAALRDAGYRG